MTFHHDRAAFWPVTIALSTLSVSLVVVQGYLGGRGLFQDADMIDVHGRVADGVALVVAIQIGFFMILARRERPARPRIVAYILLPVLTATQIGLGYVGREDGDAAAWHIANGLLLLAVSVFIMTTEWFGIDRSLPQHRPKGVTRWKV